MLAYTLVVPKSVLTCRFSIGGCLFLWVMYHIPNLGDMPTSDHCGMEVMWFEVMGFKANGQERILEPSLGKDGFIEACRQKELY